MSDAAEIVSAPVDFDSIDAAAVALLEPVLAAEPDWRERLEAGFARLADASLRVDAMPDLETLAELSVLLQARLFEADAAQAAAGDAAAPEPDGDAGLRAQAGAWVVDLIDLCAGRLDPAQAGALADGDADLAHRLVALTTSIAALRDEVIAPAEASQPTIARDELAMLADEAAALVDEIADGDGQAAVAALADGLERIGDAARLLGFEALPGLLDRRARPSAEPPDQAPSLSPEAPALSAEALTLLPEAPALPAEALTLLPEALARLFVSAGTDRDALELLAGSAVWPDQLAPGLLEAAHAELDALRLVESRQIEVPDLITGEPDLSLTIPRDADRSVVDTLLHELPVLSAQLSERIASLDAADRDDLVAAQRFAHTLKGSANTVGVRGIATITHRLEDLLQLVSGRPDRLSPELRILLDDAADCVAEMCEAVAGVGPAPAQAADVHARMLDWIGRLLGDPTGQAHGGGDAEGDAGARAGLSVGEVTVGEVPLSGAALGEVPLGEVHLDEVHLDEVTLGAFTTGITSSESTRGDVTLDGAPESPPPSVPASGALAPEPASTTADDGVDAGATEIRVPAALVGRLLDLVDEAAILVAHAREQAQELERSRATMRLGGDQLQDLASELERLVDIRGLALDEQRARSNFDSLELDEYNDLHTVSRRIAEAGADGKLVEQQLGSNVATLRDSLARLERLQAELRDCALRTRMTSIGSIAPRLQRTVRQAARMAGREAVLQIDGADTLVEAGMLSVLVDALAHLLRNAVDHGIEPRDRRLALGKPAVGTIRLTAARSGASLIVTCQDDGNGIDVQAVRERAVALGLIDATARPDPAALRALILTNGFSTRDRASQLSGRGIGLDVVRQAIDGLRGAIDIDSEPQRGTRFTIRVPLGLASLPVMLLRAPGFALALSVRGIERIVPAPLPAGRDESQSAAGCNESPPPAGRDESPALLRLDGVDWPLLAIEAVLGLPSDAFERDDSVDDAPAGRSALLLHGADGRRTALVVVEPEAPRSVVVRPMPAHVPRIPGIEGVAVLGDGAVAPVLDLAALLTAHADGSLDAGAAAGAAAQPVAAPQQQLRCLVVDDSVSVRRTMEQFVSDLGFEVEGAADGLEALERLRRRVPDLLLVDMEMPRMNGVELVRTLRADPRIAGVPVIMITSRYSERHKKLALDAGVDVFLTKPYTEDALASQIHASLGAAAAGLQSRSSR